MKQQHVGWMCLGLAGLLLLGNIGDIIGQWQDWKIATTPEFIGAVLKQIANVGMAALGGKLLPSGTDQGA